MSNFDWEGRRRRLLRYVQMHRAAMTDFKTLFAELSEIYERMAGVLDECARQVDDETDEYDERINDAVLSLFKEGVPEALSLLAYETASVEGCVNARAEAWKEVKRHIQHAFGHDLDALKDDMNGGGSAAA